MSYEYDIHSDVLYVKVSNEPVCNPQQEMPDGIIIDVDADGRLVGVEVIGASRGFDLATIVKRYDLDNDALMEMVCAIQAVCLNVRQVTAT